jgi:hypothetical protein
LRACAFDEMTGIYAARLTDTRKARVGNCQERLGQGSRMPAAVADHFIVEAIRLS